MVFGGTISVFGTLHHLQAFNMEHSVGHRVKGFFVKNRHIT